MLLLLALAASVSASATDLDELALPARQAAAQSQAATLTPPQQEALASAIERFLAEAFIKRDADAAVRSLSPSLADRSYIPDLDGETQAAQGPVPNARVVREWKVALNRLYKDPKNPAFPAFASVAEMLTPAKQSLRAEFAEVLDEGYGKTPLSARGGAMLFFPVAKARDLGIAASGAPRRWPLWPDVAAGKLRPWGAVIFVNDGTNEVPLLTLWVEENGAWKLWALLPVPTQ